MTKNTRTIHWGGLFAGSLLTVCGLAGCGQGPTAPSATQPAPSATQPRAAAPTILSITPSIGSTGGGASITITGTGLLPGIHVAFGTTNTTNVSGFFSANRDRINVTTPIHSPGSVDVVVTNFDGQNAVAIGAYTFADPESFDANGNWRGVSFAGDDQESFTFTVVDGAVVSLACATSGLVTLSPPAPLIHGAFSFGTEGHISVAGRILAPNQAMGDVNVIPGGRVGPCVGAEWFANKE